LQQNSLRNGTGNFLTEQGILAPEQGIGLPSLSKIGGEHIVPLSTAALAAFEKARTIANGSVTMLETIYISKRRHRRASIRECDACGLGAVGT
jgi:hypothetical protein